MMLIALLQLSIMGKKFIRNPALDLDWKPINWSVCLPISPVDDHLEVEYIFKSVSPLFRAQSCPVSNMYTPSLYPHFTRSAL